MQENREKVFQKGKRDGEKRKGTNLTLHWNFQQLEANCYFQKNSHLSSAVQHLKTPQSKIFSLELKGMLKILGEDLAISLLRQTVDQSIDVVVVAVQVQNFRIELFHLDQFSVAVASAGFAVESAAAVGVSNSPKLDLGRCTAQDRGDNSSAVYYQTLPVDFA